MRAVLRRISKHGSKKGFDSHSQILTYVDNKEYEMNERLNGIITLEIGEDITPEEAEHIMDGITIALEEAYDLGRQDAWDNIKEIYDTTDYKKHIEEAKTEVAKDCIEMLSDWEEWEAAVEAVKKKYGVCNA